MAAEHVKDLEEVTALIQLYIDGANGDVDKLKQAFHPDARMMGRFGGREPTLDQFMAGVAANPGLAGPDYRAFIRSIDLAGDAGVAVLVEHDYMGCDFVDFFSVARLDDRWTITNKTFAHTGGQPPAPAGD